MRFPTLPLSSSRLMTPKNPSLPLPWGSRTSSLSEEPKTQAPSLHARKWQKVGQKVEVLHQQYLHPEEVTHPERLLRGRAE